MDASVLAAGLAPTSHGLATTELALALAVIDCSCRTPRCDEALSRLYEEAEALQLRTPPPSPRQEALPEAQEMVCPAPLVNSWLFPGLLNEQRRRGRTPAVAVGFKFVSESSTRAPLEKLEELKVARRASKHGQTDVATRDPRDRVKAEERRPSDLAEQILDGLKNIMEWRA